MNAIDTVVNIKSGVVMVVELDSVRSIGDIKDRFACHTRHDSYCEAILDGKLLEEKERFYMLCELLDIAPSSAIGTSIKKADYIVFHV